MALFRGIRTKDKEWWVQYSYRMNLKCLFVEDGNDDHGSYQWFIYILMVSCWIFSQKVFLCKPRELGDTD